MQTSQIVSRLDASRTISLAFSLPLRHQAELQDLLHGLSDPQDARCGSFLTPQQFAERFSPTPAQYSQAIAYAKSVGLTITGTHPNRTLVDVSAPVSLIERAFSLHLLVYQSQRDGRYFYAPDAEPRVPAALASVFTGIVGLDNAARWHPHLQARPVSAIAAPLDTYAQPQQTGSGPYGGLTPSDIKAAYSLSSAAQNGSGQTLGLFELDGYTASDITAYESYYFPQTAAVPLQKVLVDGYSGAAGSGADEVTLDIELQVALAPRASKIFVYEGPNSDTGVVDTYNKIATDNLAKQISTSWGEAEYYPSSATLSSENQAFQQMAAQGQSIYGAAGDHGAYDDGTSLGVDDPASQPYMVGVGGTSLTTSGAGGAYGSETTWNRGSASSGAGGGGQSIVWNIPDYQSGVVSAASKGSATMRNVPDVSLDADPYTGYSIYFNGGWNIYGGTSCAAPLWAAFTALVNQQRALNGQMPLGFADTPIYTLAQSSSYGADFHDIADGSTNLSYPAVTGYDDATGWGSFSGAALLADLSGGAAPSSPALPLAPTGLTAAAGKGQVLLNWTASTGATGYNVYRGTTPGGESATPLKTNLTGTAYADAGLAGNMPYYYRVTATNSAGESSASGEAAAALNTPPTVTLTAPTGGAAYTVGTPITLTASASDSDGSIAQVAFYAGSTLLGTIPSSPYSLTWTSAAAGTYTLTAVATDNSGAATTSAAVTITVSATAPATGTGLTGTYFANQTLTAPAALTRLDPTVSFNWGYGSPAASIPVDHFSARWTGYVQAPASGSYTFSTVSDDGVRLWVNGTEVINNWTNHAPTTNTSRTITLVKNQQYAIKMEYYENTAAAQAALEWAYPGMSKTAVIPAASLFPGP